MDHFNFNQQEVEKITTVRIASPTKRIVAYIINQLITILMCLPLLIATIVVVINEKDEGIDFSGNTQLLVLFGFGLLVIIIYGIAQIYQMTRYGQSFGKKIMGIKVIRVDGQDIGWRNVVVREIVYSIIIALIAGIVTTIINLFLSDESSASGNIQSIIQSLFFIICFIMLFNKNKDRRTLQDYLAGSVVVELPKK